MERGGLEVEKGGGVRRRLEIVSCMFALGLGKRMVRRRRGEEEKERTSCNK